MQVHMTRKENAVFRNHTPPPPPTVLAKQRLSAEINDEISVAESRSY